MKYNLTAAVVGTGFMGQQHLDALKGLVSEIIVCSSDIEKGKHIAENLGAKFYSDYFVMLENEKIDVVHVCVPTPLHCKMTVAALEKGINVLCEKPFATCLEEAKQMIEASEKSGARLMIGQCVRFAQTHEYLKRCIEDKRFGKITYLQSYRHGPIPDWSVGNWLQNPSITGGAVRDLHIHDTDFIRSVFGMPQSVYSKGNPLISDTTFEYGNGVVISATCCWRSSAKYVFNSGYHAAFEHASVICKDAEVTVFTDTDEFNPLATEKFPEYLQKDGVTNEIEYFYHCIITGDNNSMCLVKDCYDSFKITHAQSESIERGEIVKL